MFVRKSLAAYSCAPMFTFHLLPNLTRTSCHDNEQVSFLSSTSDVIIVSLCQFCNFETLTQPYFICIPTWGKRENVWLSADVNRHIATQPGWDQISSTTKLHLSLKKCQLDFSIIIYLWHPQKYYVLHWRLYYRLPSPVCIPSQDQTASERKPVKYKIALLLTSHKSKDRCKHHHSSYWENK